MFVPRALRIKGIARPSTSKQTPSKGPTDNDDQDAKEEIRKDQPRPRKHGSSSTQEAARTKSLEHHASLLAGVELLFTDYAHQDPEGMEWLTKHYRTVDGMDNYVHLSAILVHQNIASLKPAPTQISLKQALGDAQPHAFLELAKGDNYVRRKPSTYPLFFIPQNASSIVNDEGLNFWDQRTIYVEPHARGFCKTPARVASWLTRHGGVKEKWLPVQSVIPLYNGCAFVVLTGNVTIADVWQKWRKKSLPKDWKIMTKAEHSRRTMEYLQLLEKDNPRKARRAKRKSRGERTGRNCPTTEVISNERTPALTSVEKLETPGAKTTTKKRKRRRKKKAANVRPGDTNVEEHDNEPVSKKAKHTHSEDEGQLNDRDQNKQSIPSRHKANNSQG